MLDDLLGWSVVFLPTALGVVGAFFSMKVPNAKHHKFWYGGLIIFGLCVSALTYWQQVRTRLQHEAEVGSLHKELARLEQIGQSQKNLLDSQGQQLVSQNEQIRQLTEDQRIESARRQQAEKDNQAWITAVGKSTRQGVARDIRDSPIRVFINGQPTRDPSEIRRVRIKLGDFLMQAQNFRTRCAIDPDGSSLEREVNSWTDRVAEYVRANLDESFVDQFSLQRSTSFSPNGVPEKRKPLWIWLDQKLEILDKFMDELKQ